MSRKSFEHFGRLALKDVSDTEKAGRYAFQHRAESNIVADVSAKLGLTPHDELLEIGCGTGNLLIPLSTSVQRAVGMDHSNLISGLRRRDTVGNIETIAGNFLETTVAGSFSKVLIYSVLQYLADDEEVLDFVTSATRLLKPKGRMLLGDLPNEDRRRRFLDSEAGADFNARWKRQIEACAASGKGKLFIEETPEDPRLVAFNDKLVLRIVRELRARRFEAFILPQPENLAFCYTREDILVCRN